jgi:hypothetical protein
MVLTRERIKEKRNWKAKKNPGKRFRKIRGTVCYSRRSEKKNSCGEERSRDRLGNSQPEGSNNHNRGKGEGII